MRTRFFKLVVLAAVFMWFQSETSAQEQRQLRADGAKASDNRTALVIGNADYATAPLRNPVNDATDMAATLESLGFDVKAHTNLDQNAMKRAIRDFGASLRARGGVGLFYFAGHGVQVKGVNYLIPIGAKVDTEEEVEYESVDAGLVLAQMESAKNRVNIVVLDACRNNPFARAFRSSDKGLASIDAPSGTLLAYATAPGSVAADGGGRNGIYTQELLKSIKTEGLELSAVFKQVRVGVLKATGEKQTPWESSSLTGDFYFSGGPAPGKAAAATTAGDSFPIKEKALTAMDILSAFRTATGTAAAAGIQSIALYGTEESVARSGERVSEDIEQFQKFPDKLLTIKKVDGVITLKQGFNGDRGWLLVPPLGALDSDREIVEANRRSIVMESGDVDEIRRLYPTIRLAGTDNVGGRQVHVLEMVTRSGTKDTLYFDAVTKLLRRWDIVITSAGEAGVKFTVETHFDDYADIKGLKIPLTMRQKLPDGESTVRYDHTRIKTNVVLDDTLFRKP